MNAETPRRFEWQRFWVDQGGRIDLADGGYLVDPAWVRSGDELRTLADLDGMRAVALLGEPGIGKSVSLEIETARRKAQPERQGVTVIHEDLRRFTSDTLLYKKIFESPKLLAWKDGDGELLLQLDSLDEALLRIDTVAALIADELPELPVERLSIRIACRTLVWPAATLMPAFRRHWGESAVGAFEIAPLRRADVRAAAEAWPVDADAFMEQVRLANAIPFAIKPLTLTLLLRLFEREGRLPEKIVDLYRRGCLSLCEEQSANRRDAQRAGRLKPVERYQIAGRAAAVSMLANRYAIWTGVEAQGVPDEDVALSALAVGAEPIDGGDIDVTQEHLREVLDTGLFSSRGDDRLGWAHQSYAEFLAADHLVARKVPTQNILSVLRHPSGGLVPQLSMVAAWTASLDKDVRSALIAHEPIVLLHGDLVGWDAGDLAALTDALLERIDSDRAHDFGLGQGDRYRKLARPGLGDQLRPYITERDHSIVARRVALRVAEACATRDLQDDLLAVIHDQADDPHIRACAVAALETCGDQAAWLTLKPLALGQAGPDPNHDIKGHALGLLWPDHVSADEAFAHLTPPRDNYFGFYANFLTETLPTTLKREDLPAALAWAAQFARGANHMGEFQLKRLADGILRTAWKYIKDPEIASLILEYVQAAIGSQHELFGGIEREANEAFRQQVAEDADGRRAFLRAALAGPVDLMFIHGLSQSGLLLPEDFYWLISLADASADPGSNGVDQATLIELITATFDWSEEQFSTLYDTAARRPALHAQYSELLDGVPLNSSRAEQLKEWHRLATERPARRRALVDPPPPQRVREQLERFEAGAVDGWWRLNHELMLETTSTHYGSELEYRITRFPGWREADEPLRARIISAACQFLESAESTVSLWIGANRVNFSDLAAYRALVLLKELAPDIYKAMDRSIWRKWASLVVGVPRDGGSEAGKVHDEITADATHSAAVEIAAAVISLVQSEKERQRSAAQAQPEAMPSFFFLHQLSSAPENPDLWAGLLNELSDEKNTPQQIAALLAFLLKAGVAEAREQGMRLFEPWPGPPERREHALETAAGLIEFAGLAVWSRLWPIIVADPDFGRELFLRIAHRHRLDQELYAGLAESELGEVYVWLSKSFPHADDTEHTDGEAHGMTPRDSVVHVRDGVLGVLVKRGNPAAVEAMRAVVAGLPHLRWLAYHQIEVDQLMRLHTWQPLTPAEVLRLVERHGGRLVQSPEDLTQVLLATLRDYEAWLHGEQAPIRGLWDLQQGGPWLRPVEEDALSDHVKVYLQRELADRGVVLNREVEISRRPGAPIGSRTDIRVDAVRRASGANPVDRITAVIETKGCWNPGLMTAIETQLRDDYLTRLSAPVGVYLVGWFDKPKWDPTDGRRARAPNWEIGEARHRLETRAADLADGFSISAFVLDCHAP